MPEGRYVCKTEHHWGSHVCTSSLQLVSHHFLLWPASHIRIISLALSEGILFLTPDLSQTPPKKQNVFSPHSINHHTS